MQRQVEREPPGHLRRADGPYDASHEKVWVCVLTSFGFSSAVEIRVGRRFNALERSKCCIIVCVAQKSPSIHTQDEAHFACLKTNIQLNLSDSANGG